jgi:molybdopterin converting factor small subunit
MKVTLNYFGQLRHIADKETEDWDCPEGSSIADVVKEAADEYGEDFGNIVFDGAGQLRPSLMVMVNDVPADKEALPGLRENDRITLLAAIAGG